jgi:site-specific DNA-adenine methylase
MSEAIQYRHAPRPVLPWMGSKEPLLDSIAKFYPAETSGCLSLFGGGLAVPLHVLHSVETGMLRLVDKDGKPADKAHFRITDILQDVVDFHNHVKSDCRSLILAIGFIIECFYDDASGITPRESYAKLKRDYNAELGKTSVVRSAQFYVLMQLCWYHAYRVDSQGAFVASFQERRTCRLESDTKANMYRVSALLRKYDVVIECASFESAREFDNDYILLDVDPPYFDVGTTSEATTYSAPLTHEQQELLVRMVKERPNRRFVMTQSNTEWIKAHFPQDDYQVVEVGVEVLISNAPKVSTNIKQESLPSPTRAPISAIPLPVPASVPVPAASQYKVTEEVAIGCSTSDVSQTGDHGGQKGESQPVQVKQEISCNHAAQATINAVRCTDAPVQASMMRTLTTAAATAAAALLATPIGDGRCMALTDKNARCRNGQRCVRCNQRGDTLGVCAVHLKKGRQDLDPDMGVRGWVDLRGGVHLLPPGQRQWVP